jgi:hypothetical protein
MPKSCVIVLNSFISSSVQFCSSTSIENTILFISENNIYMEKMVSWRFGAWGENIWIGVWT